MQLHNLLAKIEKNPGMYLGGSSITRLSAFIDGYMLGIASEETFFAGFQEWVAAKYGIKSSHKWSDIILFFEQGEERAFHRFFDLVREYSAE